MKNYFITFLLSVTSKMRDTLKNVGFTCMVDRECKGNKK